MNARNATFFKVMKRSIDVVPEEQRLRDRWPKRKKVPSHSSAAIDRRY
jgi:hypothetical protein